MWVVLAAGSYWGWEVLGLAVEVPERLLVGEQELLDVLDRFAVIDVVAAAEQVEFLVPVIVRQNIAKFQKTLSGHSSKPFANTAS